MVKKYDIETALLIISVMEAEDVTKRQDGKPTLYEQANSALQVARYLNRDFLESLEEIDREWVQIKNAFIAIGVPAHLLND